MRTRAKVLILTGVMSSFGLGSLAGYHLLVAYYSKVQVTELTQMEHQTASITKIPERTFKSSSVPVQISIPKLQVTASIQPVGLDQAGRMATIPNPKTIAWYAYGASPGGPGNAILAGHRDWNGVLGSFWAIDHLQLKDRVYIHYSNGSEGTFTVISVHTYPGDDVPPQVMEMSGEERTTLITCAGDFIRNKGGYQSRVVVTLEQLSQSRKG